MEMSLEDTLVALGLEDEGTASTRTGGEWGGNSFAVPIGWSGSYMGDFRTGWGILRLPLAPLGVIRTQGGGLR